MNRLPLCHVLRCWAAGCLVALALSGVARAQTEARRPVPRVEAAEAQWQLIVDGAPAAWEAPPLPADSLRAGARSAVVQLQRAGFYLARTDSAAVDSSASPTVVRLYVSRGPKVHVGRVQIDGTAVLPEEQIRGLMDTRPGRVLDPQRLEADLQAILAAYEAEGYPLAQVRVEEVALRPGAASGTKPTLGPGPTLGVRLAIDEGGVLWLKTLDVSGRTDAAYAAHVAGLAPGAPLTGYDPQAIRERLEATGLYESVGPPELRVGVEGATTLFVPVEEEPPGAFDLVLGYLPPQGGADGRVVGNGQLALRNLFGGGRALALRLDRTAGQVSEAHVEVADPYFLKLPLRVALGFDGRQQDSTYNKQAYRIRAGYEFASGIEVFGTLSREAVRPGERGTVLRGGSQGGLTQQRVARADAWFAGLGLRWQRLDDRLNPRRGVLLEANLEQGRKERAARVVTAAGDTTARQETLRQERLEVTGRFFVPTLARQAAVLGVDAGVLLSGAYDASDLYRLGGARSLRGYDEDRFRGNVAARALAEYRYQLDRRSFAYAFFDLGYVQTPALARGEPAARGWHPGYGLGLQFDTRLGLVNASYALNPDDGPANGRVHLGLSVGL